MRLITSSLAFAAMAAGASAAHAQGTYGAEPTFWGREKKRSIATWSRHVEILAITAPP